MEIQYLHLAGFKRHPDGTDITFLPSENSILESKGEDLHYYFRIILGIIFGLDDLEKEDLRDSEGSNIFTGLIRLRLDDRMLIIERDFETDILACMLDYQGSSKVVFHDRDFVHAAPDRPYLHFLKNYLTFTDKQLISQLIFLPIDISDPSLKDVLDHFYDICTPRIQLAELKASLQEYGELLESENEERTSGIRKDLLRYEKRKQLIKTSLKVEKQLEHLRRISRLWDILNTRVLEKQNESAQLSEILNQKYPLLKNFDGDKLRKDVLVWKELISQKYEYDKKHRAVQSEIDTIEKTLNGELLLYRSIPATFENDIQHFQEQSEKLSKNTAALEEIKSRTADLESSFAIRRRNLFYVAALLPLIAGAVTYLIFGLPAWICAGSILVTGLAVLGIYASVSTRYKSDLWIQNFEESRLRNENSEIGQWLQHLRSKTILVEDYEKKEKHIACHRRARELKRVLENLRAEQAVFLESWKNHDGFKRILEFNDAYGKVIDLKRENLIEYLENFSELKNLLNNYGTYDASLLRRIRRYKRAFQLLTEKLAGVQQNIQEHADFDERNQTANDLLNRIEEDIERLKKGSGK